MLLVLSCLIMMSGTLMNMEPRACNSFKFFIENFGMLYLNCVLIVYGFWLVKDISRCIFLKRAMIRKGASSA